MKRINWMTDKKRANFFCHYCGKSCVSKLCCDRIEIEGLHYTFQEDGLVSGPWVQMTGYAEIGYLDMRPYVQRQGDTMTGTLDIHTNYTSQTFIGIDWASGRTTAFRDTPNIIEDNFVTTPAQYPAG